MVIVGFLKFTFKLRIGIIFQLFGLEFERGEVVAAIDALVMKLGLRCADMFTGAVCGLQLAAIDKIRARATDAAHSGAADELDDVLRATFARNVNRLYSRCFVGCESNRHFSLPVWDSQTMRLIIAAVLGLSTIILDSRRAAHRLRLPFAFREKPGFLVKTTSATGARTAHEAMARRFVNPSVMRTGRVSARASAFRAIQARGFALSFGDFRERGTFAPFWASNFATHRILTGEPEFRSGFRFCQEAQMPFEVGPLDGVLNEGIAPRLFSSSVNRRRGDVQFTFDARISANQRIEILDRFHIKNIVRVFLRWLMEKDEREQVQIGAASSERAAPFHTHVLFPASSYGNDRAKPVKESHTVHAKAVKVRGPIKIKTFTESMTPDCCSAVGEFEAHMCAGLYTVGAL